MEPILRAAGTNGGGRVGSEYGVEAYRLYLAIEAIRELGVLLKDLDTGLWTSRTSGRGGSSFCAGTRPRRASPTGTRSRRLRRPPAAVERVRIVLQRVKTASVAVEGEKYPR
jgi:hypothetical protein